jgi:hypothetical protein
MRSIIVGQNLVKGDFKDAGLKNHHQIPSAAQLNKLMSMLLNFRCRGGA